jgi:hypothetical protein
MAHYGRVLQSTGRSGKEETGMSRTDRATAKHCLRVAPNDAPCNYVHAGLKIMFSNSVRAEISKQTYLGDRKRSK